MLESLEGTNIKKLTIEVSEKEEELLFDFDRDVTPEDIEDMKIKLARYHSTKEWAVFAETVIFFDHYHIPYDPLTSEEVESMKEQISLNRIERNPTRWDLFSTEALCLEAQNIPYDPLTSEEVEKMRELLSNRRGIWHTFVPMALYFDRHNIPYDPLTSEELKEIKKDLLYDRTKKYWFCFALLALYLEAHKPHPIPKLKSDIPPKPIIKNF